MARNPIMFVAGFMVLSCAAGVRAQEEDNVRAQTEESDYRGVSDFFNVREANANVTQGEWELEIASGWSTDSAGGDDDFFFPEASLKYGITDELFVELELLPINLGDGGDQGNGDLDLTLFYQFVQETDTMPAVGSWVEMRIPTGQGSSGVDGEFHTALTKSINDQMRVHLAGFIETANGGRGDEDKNRRRFQWGVGPGFDYQFDDQTLGLVNYLITSSEEYGNQDSNVLQFGLVRELAETESTEQTLKLALDVGLDGHEGTPNFAFMVQWAVEWR